MNKEQILELERKLDWAYSMISKKDGIIADQAKQLENVRELARLGQKTLNQIMEASE